MSTDAKDTEGFEPIDAKALIADASRYDDKTRAQNRISGTLLNRETGEEFPGVEVRFRADDGMSYWGLGKYDSGAEATEGQPAQLATGARGPWVFLEGSDFLKPRLEPSEKWFFKRDV